MRRVYDLRKVVHIMSKSHKEEENEKTARYLSCTVHGFCTCCLRKDRGTRFSTGTCRRSRRCGTGSTGTRCRTRTGRC